VEDVAPLRGSSVLIHTKLLSVQGIQQILATNIRPYLHVVTTYRGILCYLLTQLITRYVHVGKHE
jgi:hypothetical protein